MYNRILVPTDGSELSDKALEAAADFAKLWFLYCHHYRY